MITYSIESQFPLETTWHTVWAISEECSTIEEIVRNLGRYRQNNPGVNYRLIKIEIIG